MNIGLAGSDEGGLKTHRLCSVALKDSVNDWPMAIIIPRHSGVSRSPISVGNLLAASLHDRGSM